MSDQPTLEKNGFVVDRTELVPVNMGFLYDLMRLTAELDPGWNSITTPDCVVELCAVVMKVDQ